MAIAFSSRHTISTEPLIRARERYDAIDLARGWALLGVAIVNAHAIARGWTNHYALDLADTWYDVLAEYIVGMVFAHRAFPTLAFLLGFGLALQWRSLTLNAADAERVPHALSLVTLRSRYVALLMLGLLHGLVLWPGDIVSAYAIVALVLLWRWPKSLGSWKRWVSVTSALLVITYALAMLSFATESTYDAPLVSPSFAYAPWSLAARMHFSEYLSYGLIQAALPEVWLAIALGVMLGQSGALERWLNGESSARGWFVFGFICFAVGTFLEVISSWFGAWDFSYPSGLGAILFTLGVPLAGAGSVFVILSLARGWSPTRAVAVRRLFIAAGRAPLTLFFGMSLLMIPIFHASFGDWHDELGRAAYTAIALAVYVLLAKFVSHWFAAGHTRGPAELAWMALAAAIARRMRAD